MTIGIGGVSRSGKTSLAFLIKKMIEERGETAVVLSQDDFVLEKNLIPKIKQKTDWESPQSIDFQEYRCTIAKEKVCNNHVITEGLLNFWDVETNALFDRRIFVIIKKDIFLSRRKEEKRWGFEPKWFVEHVWKSYLKYGQTILSEPKNGVLVVSGVVDFDVDLIKGFLSF